MISQEIKRYKEMVSSLNASELLAILNNSRLTVDERFAVEWVDLFCKTLKETSNAMDTDERQVNRYLQRARLKILKQILK